VGKRTKWRRYKEAMDRNASKEKPSIDGLAGGFAVKEKVHHQQNIGEKRAETVPGGSCKTKITINTWERRGSNARRRKELH